MTDKNCKQGSLWSYRLRVFVFAQIAWPVMWALEQAGEAMREPMHILIVGAVLLLAFVPFAYVMVLRNATPAARRNPFTYVFAVFALICIVDLILALENDQHISGFASFYLDKGEVYLQTAYGSVINYWDGITHFVLYVNMCACLARNSSIAEARDEALFWVGSMLLSLVVFLPGNVAGMFGDQILPAFFLNVPFVFVPIGYGATVLTTSRTSSGGVVKPTSALARLLRLVVVVLLVATFAVCMFRGTIAMGETNPVARNWLDEVEPLIRDPTEYHRLFPLVQFYYFMPFFALAAYTLYASKDGAPPAWLRDWSAVFAGATAQGEFSYILSAIHFRTEPRYRHDSLAALPTKFIAVHTLLIAAPILLWVYCLVVAEKRSLVKKLKSK